MSITIADIRAAQPEWFSRSNKRFFGDLSYCVLHDKKTHDAYLVRSTTAWTDMFGGMKKIHWRLNAIDKETLKIGPLVDRTFQSLDEVREWLAGDDE